MPLPYIFGTQTGVIPLNELDENFAYLENLVPALAVTAGTVIAANQPNITGIGTLSTLNCTGTVTAGTVTAGIINGVLSSAAQPNITEVGVLANLSITNSLSVNTVNASMISASALMGTLSTAAQPGITSLGTLSSLTVAGGITGTLSTAAQPNVTSLGTLTALAVSGSITGTLATAAQPNVTSVGTLTNLSVAGGITGTLSTANQPNITSVGTLGALAVTGNIAGGNLSISGTSALNGVVTAPTAANGTNSTQIATTAFVQNSLSSTVPSGVIVMWSGSVASIPLGWLLCNGTSGTPDLRNRFVVGAGSTYNPGATGGSADATVVAHTHTATSVVTDPGHAHSYNSPSDFQERGNAGGSVVDSIVPTSTGTAATGISVTTTVASTGSSGINANLPPYYALAYIMKA
jgi:hypothetical protein